MILIGKLVPEQQISIERLQANIVTQRKQLIKQDITLEY